MNITQSYNGRGRLKPESICARGVQTDNLHLITGAQESRSSSIFTCLVNGVITRSATRIEVVVQCPVVTPSGTYNTITIMVMHPEDEDMNALTVGQTFSRGEIMFYEGKDGYATGNHFHISVGTGNYSGGKYGNGWEDNDNDAWVLTPTGTTLKPEQAFYIDPSITGITDDKNLNFITVPN